MCTVLLPPGDNPITVNKYIILYIVRPPVSWRQQDRNTLRTESLCTGEIYVYIPHPEEGGMMSFLLEKIEVIR